MKVLYIGHYKEKSGWSNAAINAIRALNTVGVDVVCRDIKLTNSQIDAPDDIKYLETKDLQNVDYCIQHVLPHHFTGTDKFKKNVAYFVNELDSIKYHHWYQNLELLDEVWVPNSDSKNNLVQDGFNDNIVRVIPHTFDMRKYVDNEARIIFNDYPHTFKFYFICEFDDRKNLESIIRCFHSEFHATEPVSLVLKVKKNGMNANNLRSEMIKFCDMIKQQMRLYKDIKEYNHEIIITEDFTEDQMKTLHQSCDCFVGPTHGEGWGIPAFDAMCFGNTPICSDEGGPKDYIDKQNKNTGWLVGGSQGICYHQNAAFFDIFTGRNHWFMPNELEIKQAMRNYYNNRESKSNDGLKNGEKFSYQNVGLMIKDALND
jgi:glycosyltransferase involved in cell wall biosynthesis